MAKRDAVRRLSDKNKTRPSCWAELYWWCSSWRSDLKPTDMRPFFEQMNEAIQQAKNIESSDKDEGPARQFHKDFVEQLNLLKDPDADSFTLECTWPIYRSESVTSPLPSGATCEVRADGSTRAEWTDVAGGKCAGPTRKDSEGNDALFTVHSVLSGEKSLVRLDYVYCCARDWCRKRAKEALEIPIGWPDDDMPDRPLRTEVELDGWLTDQMRVCDRLYSSPKDKVDLSRRLRTLIDLVELWLNEHLHADTARPMMYVERVEPYGMDAKRLRAHLLELQKYLRAVMGTVGKPALAAPSSGVKPVKRSFPIRRKPLIEPSLTDKQMEAVHIVGECKGNIAEAARRLGKDYSTIRQHYKAATAKLGKKAVKHSTKRLATDGRGQANVATDADKRL